MDAFECGIVKLPRVLVVDNVPGAQTPVYRDLWGHIGKQMSKKRAKGHRGSDRVSRAHAASIRSILISAMRPRACQRS